MDYKLALPEGSLAVIILGQKSQIMPDKKLSIWLKLIN